jgi:hypothetical protein
MKRIFILFIITLLSFAIYAQDNSVDALKEINTIKLSGKHIWAEGTSMKNEKEALENALAVLSYEIQNQLHIPGNQGTTGVIIPTNDKYLKIQTRRGNLYRAFVYADKELIISYNRKEVYEPNEFEKQMLTVTKATDIEAFVKQSTIAQYGKYKERPTDGEYYLIVYNREGSVPACLKFINGKVTNVATGKEDSIQNYKGCGAYWFIQKK